MLKQIPIKTITEDSCVFPGFVMAKSGVKFQNAFEQSQLMCGFGFNECKESAIYASRFEALEHLFATYDFQKDSITKNGNLYCEDLKKTNCIRAIPASSVLVGPIPKELGKSNDANGLGCHVSYSNALEHAVFEMLERHCLAQVWYGPLGLVEIEEIRGAIGSFRTRCFTLEATPLPFAIVILDNIQEGIWALGSAVRHTLGAAVRHAQHEAMMLIESSLIEKGVSYSEEIDSRILSLKIRDMSIARESYLNFKVNGVVKLDMVKPVENMVAIIENALGCSDEIFVVDLCNCAELSVVRVICAQAQNPRWHRSMNSRAPYDPFC